MAFPRSLPSRGWDIRFPGWRGLYAHASQRMREDLTAALQARWEDSLRERAAIDPNSPVLLLDNLLTPFQAGSHDGAPVAVVLAVRRSWQRRG